jgi:hypothetical protein
MSKGRFFMIFAMLTATALSTAQFKAGSSTAIAQQNSIWAMLPWLVPMVLVALVAVNSIWFTRFVSWLIFATAFFAFLVVLSAFTLRFRSEAGLNAWPFYRAMVMYIAFIYSSLAQIKLLTRDGGQGGK